MPAEARSLLAALLVMPAVLIGCKSACEKAIDHMADCLSDYCSTSAEAPVCRRLAEQALEAPECTEAAAAQAEAMLSQSCETLTGAFTSYMRGAQTIEATSSLRAMTLGARAYYETEHVTPTGDFLPLGFPASVPMTPRAVPCGERVVTEASHWAHPTWDALSFRVADPHYFAYQFDSRGEGPDATFVATAFGDLDCDGQLSTFQIAGHVAGGSVELSELRSYNEGE